MQVIDAPPRNVSARQRAWLEEESRHWQAAGTIDAAARHAILDRYTAESAERRGMVAVVLLAVGMCSLGLLLLIGYNWDRIPRTAKLAIVIGSVAAAFGASAFAAARQRPAVAETLAFFGTLLFGNAIWLVAQVLHIEGRFPDAFLWWGVGALACAWLVRSEWVGALGAAIVLVWVGAEGEFSRGPGPAFLIVWPLAVGIAYSLRSPLMICIVAPGAALAVFLSRIGNSHSALWLGSVALTGAALYGIGRWHEPDNRLRRAWQMSGLLVLLLVSIPLMVTAVHKDLAPRNADAGIAWIAIAAALAAGASVVRTSRVPADDAVLAGAAATGVWMVASWSGWFGASAGFAMSATVLFSILSLVMTVSLIRTALVTSRFTDLAAGVLFAVVFLIVRWTSVIENLLWSGLLLLAAGAGLLVIARLWRGRTRLAVGRVS